VLGTLAAFVAVSAVVICTPGQDAADAITGVVLVLLGIRLAAESR